VAKLLVRAGGVRGLDAGEEVHPLSFFQI